MNITDQPGRVLALFIFCPIILCKGIKYKDNFLVFFSLFLFFWELLWITKYEPKKIC